jgi:hypothetical protein
MRKGGRLAGMLVAAASLLYLGAMVVTGASPVQRQLVRFEAKGVLKLPPERIGRVEIHRADQQITLVRTGETSWRTADGLDIGGEAGKRVSMAVQMMHTSGPVREIGAGELAGVDRAPFGLDPPSIAARLYGQGGEPVLAALFGARNPDDFLQYMQLEGDTRLFLMSRFVGEEWAEAMKGSLGQ